MSDIWIPANSDVAIALRAPALLLPRVLNPVPEYPGLGSDITQPILSWDWIGGSRYYGQYRGVDVIDGPAGGFTFGRNFIEYNGTDNANYGLIPDELVPTEEITLLFIQERLTSSSGENKSAFGSMGSVSNNRCHAHIVYSGLVYWDFGGSSTGRISIGQSVDANELNVWVFTSAPGSRGLEIWRNGVRIKNGGTPLTRVVKSGGTWGIGSAVSTTNSANQRVYRIAMWDRQLPISEIEHLSDYWYHGQQPANQAPFLHSVGGAPPPQHTTNYTSDVTPVSAYSSTYTGPQYLTNYSSDVTPISSYTTIYTGPQYTSNYASALVPISSYTVTYTGIQYATTYSSDVVPTSAYTVAYTAPQYTTTYASDVLPFSAYTSVFSSPNTLYTSRVTPISTYTTDYTGPQYTTNYISTVIPLSSYLAVYIAPASAELMGISNAGFHAEDGSGNSLNINPSFIPDKKYTIALRFSDTANEMQLGYKEEGGAWTWTALTNYSAIASVSKMILGDVNAIDFWLLRAKVYPAYKSTAWIESEYP